VARVLGINRQQFNNYITGKNLPNETVVDKICKYFKVDAAYMFRQVSENATDEKIKYLTPSHRRIVSKFAEFEIKNKKKALADGLYYVYFANNDADKSVVCSLLAVKNESGLCTFRRITRDRRHSFPPGSYLQSCHYGIATLNDSKISLVGVDVFEKLAITLLSGISIFSSNLIYGGIAAVSTGIDFKNVPFVIAAVKKGYTLRQAMSEVKVYPINSSLLDESVTQYLIQADLRMGSR
jgi:transcriptional regulator with XRE-family HTH domain